MGKDIWVICDNDCYNSNHNLQLINKAKQLSTHRNRALHVICIGLPDENAFDDIGVYGIDSIIYTETETKDILMHINILDRLIREKKPELLMFPSTMYAKALSAALSSRLQAGLVADCIDITVDGDGGYIYARAAINDSVIARIKCMNSDYELCTVKQNVFMLSGCALTCKPVVEKYTFDTRESAGSRITPIHVLSQTIIDSREAVEINSNVVFAVGRGVKEKGTVELIRKLAAKYKAGLIGTRAAVEEGLIEKERQVGQSGASICPNLYIGFGISGASQHMVGIKNSKKVIAVNSDKNAPIFNYADYAIVDNLDNVLKDLSVVSNHDG